MSEVTLGKVEPIYTQNGRLTGYRLEMQHAGLHEYRLLRAPDTFSLKNKANVQLANWNEKWIKATAKNKLLESKIQSKENAELQTELAQAALHEASMLLFAATQKTNAINWLNLEDRRSFVFVPGTSFPDVLFDKTSGAPISPIYRPAPKEPNPNQFNPEISFTDRLIPGRVKKKKQFSKDMLLNARSTFFLQSQEVQDKNTETDVQFAAAKSQYDQERHAFLADQETQNLQLYDLKKSYERGDSASVVSIVNIILDQANYPEWMPKDYAAEFNQENSLLILDCILPSPEALPSITKCVYIASRNELKTSFLSDGDKSKLYDSVVYQICLRTIYLIFSADYLNKISSIVFNGWLTWTKKATGLEESGCLLSLQAKKEEISKIDFSKVEPKACFRELKGISAAKLSGITPIAPIAKLSMEDSRFVASHDVINVIDAGINLAEIDWEEFEHFVRELFAAEFSKDGGHVKITRASSDGGVDAVAFDPDPIRGGKIVIQAKRYTNTVGVSAVRDLYGTMMNEGAMKGILVTTSDYGSDSYTFAKDKPITLLNGGNLLQLLEKHGHRARIDLAEARRNRETKSV